MVFRHKTFVNESAIKTGAQQLIYSISFELLIICAFILCMYLLRSLYYLVGVTSVAASLVLLNLYVFKRSKNIVLCGHLLTIILFLTILISNYLARGINFSFSIWLYVIPVLSVVLVGRNGLFIYSTLSLIVIMLCGLISIPPYYSLSINELSVIGWANHLFAFVVIASSLNSATRISNQYEKSLQIEKDKYTYLARFDGLTGLPNRHYFLHGLEDALPYLIPDQCITLFFMDLDNLKSINDDYGHKTGDDVLKETARRLTTCFREGDFVARLSGDEFIAYIIHTQNDDIAKEITQKIELVFQQDFQFNGHVYPCSISIGQSTYPKEAKTLEMLMSLADASMYEAKKKKKLVR